jgi:hypothetical protein
VRKRVRNLGKVGKALTLGCADGHKRFFVIFDGECVTYPLYPYIQRFFVIFDGGVPYTYIQRFFYNF